MPVTRSSAPPRGSSRGSSRARAETENTAPERKIIGGPPSTISPHVRTRHGNPLETAPTRLRALEETAQEPLPPVYRHAILALEAEFANSARWANSTTGEAPETVQRLQQEQEQIARRRARIDERTASSQVQYPIPQAVLAAARVARRIPPNHPIYVGARQRRDEPLKHEDLWKDGIGPPEQLPVVPYHRCAICQGVKSHPVTSGCGHSHCYVCIRLWLERQFTCPQCVKMMYCAPFRQYAEEASIEHFYPGWQDLTVVDYSWDGLTFPRAPRRIVAPGTSSQLN